MAVTPLLKGLNMNAVPAAEMHETTPVPRFSADHQRASTQAPSLFELPAVARVDSLDLNLYSSSSQT